MKTLYLVRHAKSSWEFDVADEKRPLNERGIKDANLIGEELSKEVRIVDRVLCSPAERARKTASIILNYLDVSEDIFDLERKLYDFSGESVINVIKSCDDEINTLMIFGHNHALTSLSNLFGNERIDNLPTAGVVGIEFEINRWKHVNVGKNILKLFPKLLK